MQLACSTIYGVNEPVGLLLKEQLGHCFRSALEPCSLGVSCCCVCHRGVNRNRKCCYGALRRGDTYRCTAQEMRLIFHSVTGCVITIVQDNYCTICGLKQPSFGVFFVKELIQSSFFIESHLVYKEGLLCAEFI